MHTLNGNMSEQAQSDREIRQYSFREHVAETGNFFKDREPLSTKSIGCKSCARHLLISLVASNVIPSSQALRIREEIQNTRLKDSCGKGIPFLFVIGTHTDAAGS